jgi:hypothetical protein
MVTDLRRLASQWPAKRTSLSRRHTGDTGPSCPQPLAQTAPIVATDELLGGWASNGCRRPHRHVMSVPSGIFPCDFNAQIASFNNGYGGKTGPGMSAPSPPPPCPNLPRLAELPYKHSRCPQSRAGSVARRPPLPSSDSAISRGPRKEYDAARERSPGLR